MLIDERLRETAGQLVAVPGMTATAGARSGAAVPELTEPGGWGP